jgi:hypothetical protein
VSGTARNAPCHCGSGKKFKRCHNLIDHERDRLAWTEIRERAKRNHEEETQARDERIASYQKPNKSALASILAMVMAGQVNR